MSEMIPQIAGQPQPAASNGVDLPPANVQSQGEDLPPVKSEDLPPAASDEADRKKFVLDQWFQQAGKALQAPAGANPTAVEARRQQAQSTLESSDAAQWSASGPPGMFGGTSHEIGNKDELGRGEHSIPLVKKGLVSDEVTPEGWAEYARSTVTPEVKSKYDAEFNSRYDLVKTLESRQKMAEEAYRNAGGTPETGLNVSSQLSAQNVRAMQAAKTAVKNAGLPDLTPQEAGQMMQSANDRGVKGNRNWFTDTAGDVAGTLVRRAEAIPFGFERTGLRILSQVSDSINGPRALGESNVFRDQIATSQEFEKQLSAYTPELSGRKDLVNWGVTELASAAPTLGAMLVASGPSTAAKLLAAAVGAPEAMDSVASAVEQDAKAKGYSDYEASNMANKAMAIVGPISVVLNYVPLHQILDKNPELRNMVVRVAQSAAVNGAASTAQDITTQLVQAGVVGKDFSAKELEDALASSLLVGGVAGIPGGHGKAGEPAKAPETAREIPAAPSKEFAADFLKEEAAAPAEQPTETLHDNREEIGNELPADDRLSQNPEFMKHLDEQQKALSESDQLVKRVNALPNTEPARGQLPDNTDLRTGKPEHPLVSMARSESPDLQTVDEKTASPEAKEAAAILRKRGIEPILAEGKNLPQGLTSKEVPNAALIDVSDPKGSLLKVTAHESGHILINNEPKVADTIMSKLPSKDAVRLEDQYRTAYERSQKRKGATPEQATKAFNDYWGKFKKDELVASAIHEAVTQDGSVRRALIGDTTTWGKIRDAVMKVVNSFSGGGRLRNEIAKQLREAFKSSAKMAEPFEVRGKRMADAYAALKHEPNSPEVKASYDALKQETKQQFEDLQKQGVKTEPWTKEGQPYKNSREMMDDVKNNKHLFFFTGGDMPADHPLAEKAKGEVTYNDMFRAVHDYYGHAVPGNQFGPRGEEKAYQAHSVMFSDKARPAMATETRGQNSFVNYGPNGEANRTNPAATVYAPQKAGILPSEFHAREGNALPRKTYLGIGHQAEGKANVDLWFTNEDGQIETRPATGKNATHVQAGAEHAAFRGRIDHTNKEISVTGEPTGPMADRQIEKLGRKLQEQHPDYQVFVSDSHGTSRLDAFSPESNFLPKEKEKDTLPSLPNIRYESKDPNISEKIKTIINGAKDSTTKFKMTWFDRVQKQVQNDMWAVVKATNAAKTRGGGAEVLPSSDPNVLFPILHGAGESHEQQRTSGMRDAKNQVLIDPATKSPITAEWKLRPIVDAAQAHFGDTKMNSVDRMQRAVVDTIVSETTIERGDNRVKAETTAAVSKKLKQIFDSLPTGSKIKSQLHEISTEGEPSEYVPADEQQAEKDAQKELNKVRKQIKEAKKLIADFQELGKSEVVTNQPGEARGGTGTPPPSEQLTKAQDRLTVLQNVLDHVQNGRELTPNDMLSQAELDKIRRTALDRPLTGISGGEHPTGHLDVKKAQETLDEMKKSKGWENIQEAGRRYRMWGDMVLQKLVDQGFLAADKARKIRTSNQFYANIQRVMDEAKLGSVYEGSAALHKFRGSNRLIDNPYVNQDVTTDRLLKASEENQARRAFVDLAGKYPDLAEKAKESGPDTITVMRDGEAEFWKVDPSIKDALESFSQYHPEFLGGVLNTFGRMKRWGVTKVPSFILRNFTRDFQDRLFKGDSKVPDILHALDQELIGEMSAVGGSVQKARAGSGRQDYHKELSRRIKEMSSDKSTILAMPSKLWQGYSHLNDVSENANRVAEYNAAKNEAKRRGWSDYDATLYAASKSRGLVDFAVAGSLVRQINRVAYMAFLNGRIQGSYGDFVAAKKSPGKVAIHALIMGMAPALAAYAVASAQGKQEEYQALPMWRRMMFTNFYVSMGPVKWISIPKVPLAALFAAPVEYGIEKSAGRQDALKSITMQGLNVFSPVDDPSVLPASFLLEGLTNYSFYYNRSIIPEWERSLPIERRNTDASSNLGKMISEMTKAAGFQIDPRFIDNSISRQFGGTGQIAESLSNVGSGKPMDTIGSFLSRSTGFTAETPGASSPDIANVYSRASNFYDENSPEIKQIAAYLKQGYEAKTRAEQDAAFSQARDLARTVRKEYDDNGDTLKRIGKFNSDINAVQADFKTATSFEARLKWAKDNPDKAKLVRAGETFDPVYARLNEVRKLRVNPKAPAATRALATREIARLTSALLKLEDNAP